MFLLKFLAPFHLSRYFKLGFILWDLILLNTTTLLSFYIRYEDYNAINLKEVQTVLLLSNVLWIILLLNKNAYQIIRIERIEAILQRTLKMIVIHTSLIFLFVVSLKYSRISPLCLLYFYLLFFNILLIFRVIFMKILKYIRSQGYNFKKVIIVGANETGEEMHKILSSDLSYGYRIMGFFDDTVDSKLALSSPVLGGFESIKNYIIKENLDEMYVTLSIDHIKVIKELTELCERYMVRIKFIPDFRLYTLSSKVEIEFYENIPVLGLRREPLEFVINELLKKIFDICFSLVVIIFLFTWLFPILILMIKMDSPGPVFFKQKRSGRDNHVFDCLKFRSMTVNGLADNLQATKDDSRITMIGTFMRKTNIDELPQFFNVLIGNMSVVGPRPHMLKHTEQYSELINNYLVRHYAKPGITGWAQVNGYRGETKELDDMKNRVKYDIWYIENWSFLLDMKIIFRTVFNMFKGEKNAY